MGIIIQEPISTMLSAISCRISTFDFLFFHRKSLILQLQCALITIIKILSFNIDVILPLDIIMILAFPNNRNHWFSTFCTTSGLIVTDRLHRVIFRIQNFLGVWSMWRPAHIVYEGLIFFVSSGIELVCVTSSWGWLKVVSENDIIELT